MERPTPSWGQDLRASVHPLVAVPAAMAVNLLPRRLRLLWDGRLPVHSTAGLSAIATACAGFAIGIPAFLAYAQRVASRANELILGSPINDHLGELQLASFFSFLAFAFFTPLGLLSTYLVLSGLLRALAAAVDEPYGDFILCGLLGLFGRVRRERTLAREITERERLEGPPVPDVLLRGRDGGAPEADYVVVASRRKPGWVPGVFVVTSEKWYRLGTPFDRRYPGGLRSVYPITEVRDLEVLRRSVHYELPPLVSSYPEAPSS